jgi:hypothetical protein
LGSFPYRRNRRCSSAESFYTSLVSVYDSKAKTYANVDLVLLVWIHGDSSAHTVQDCKIVDKDWTLKRQQSVK